jgi:hypothetical protein
MNCYLHTDQEAKAYCRSCGRPLCEACQRLAQGTVYCVEHAPPQPAAEPAPAPAPQPGGASPGLAFVLGLIPGVGAIYNGQYVKGLIHVIVLGVLISIVSSGSAGVFEPLFGLLIALWFFYMAFEAYHTASRRLRGLPVDEFSSLIPVRSPEAGSTAAAVALILLGTLFLVMNTRPEWTRFLFKLWPLALIAIGVYLLLARWRTRSPSRPAAQEADHERP